MTANISCDLFVIFVGALYWQIRATWDKAEMLKKFGYVHLGFGRIPFPNIYGKISLYGQTLVGRSQGQATLRTIVDDYMNEDIKITRKAPLYAFDATVLNDGGDADGLLLMSSSKRRPKKRRQQGIVRACAPHNTSHSA